MQDAESLIGSRNTICLRPFPGTALEANLRLCDTRRAEATCRICHLDKGESLLSPCLCSGSIQHVCSECLEEWRKRNPARGASCELCGVAFLYKSERMTWQSRVNFVLSCSGKALALSSLLLCGEVVKLSNIHVWEPLLLLMGVAMFAEAMRDLYRSCSECSPGCLGYSIRRICKYGNVDAMDVWELHKLEWARDGIFPYEPEHTTTCICNCKIFLQVLAVYILTFLIIAEMAGMQIIIPWMESEAGQRAQKIVSKALLIFGVGYTIILLTIHTISCCQFPPVQLCRANNGNLIVRSLHESERRSRVQSR